MYGKSRYSDKLIQLNGLSGKSAKSNFTGGFNLKDSIFCSDAEQSAQMY
ncbi:hypothetical protein yrohd0001_34930 [Yersinia rohdei ATCC 43380]|nr:hypothetical protein yrohd0001_34930 [Yersinia rohdei ATCC 43380]